MTNKEFFKEQGLVELRSYFDHEKFLGTWFTSDKMWMIQSIPHTQNVELFAYTESLQKFLSRGDHAFSYFGITPEKAIEIINTIKIEINENY